MAPRASRPLSLVLLAALATGAAVLARGEAAGGGSSTGAAGAGAGRWQALRSSRARVLARRGRMVP